MIIVNAGTACSHRLRGRTRASYNILEVTDERVRVILKHPFEEPETVADYARDLRKVCVWQPSGIGTPEGADAVGPPWGKCSQ